MFAKHPIAVAALGCVVECPIPAFHRKEVRDSQQPGAARVAGWRTEVRRSELCWLCDAPALLGGNLRGEQSELEMGGGR